MSAIETIYDYFEDHSKAAAAVKETRPILLGMFGISVGAVSIFVAHGMADRLGLLTFSVSSLCLTLLWELMAGFVTAAALHLILDFEGAQGSATSLFILLGMANLVWALAVPFVLICRLLLPASSWASTLVFLLVGLMSFGLKARSIRDNYQTTSTRAWISLGLPYLALVVAMILALSLAIYILLIKALQWAQ